MSASILSIFDSPVFENPRQPALANAEAWGAFTALPASIQESRWLTAHELLSRSLEADEFRPDDWKVLLSTQPDYPPACSTIIHPPTPSRPVTPCRPLCPAA